MNSAATKNSAFELESKIASLVDDENFNNLHRRLSPFNLFEAVGAVRGGQQRKKAKRSLLQKTPLRATGVTCFEPSENIGCSDCYVTSSRVQDGLITITARVRSRTD